MRNGMSCSEAGRLGVKKTIEIEKNKKEKRIEEYLKNPTKCKFCKKELPYKKRRNKFCNQSCAASVNNKGVRRNGKILQDILDLRRKEYEKNLSFCKQCNEPLSYKRRYSKFCDSKCHALYQKPKQKCMECSGDVRSRKNKFCSHKCSSIFRNKIKDKEIEAGKCNSVKPLKRYLLGKNGHQCEICKSTHWNNEPIPIVMDHINGHSENNNLDNLRLICPNCDAQLPTYKGRKEQRKWQTCKKTKIRRRKKLLNHLRK